jgi:hypothetical protein
MSTHEFQQSIAAPDGEPAQTKMGASKIAYGVHANSGAPYAEPGSEGATAVELLQKLGVFSKHETNPTPPTAD